MSADDRTRALAAERAQRYRQRQRDGRDAAERHADPPAESVTPSVTRAVTTVGTTKAERADLQRVTRMRARIAKADVAVREAELLADAEDKLSAVFSAHDAAWRDAQKIADGADAEVNRRIAEVCDARGVPKSFRPSRGSYWSNRGENSLAGRRAELRKRAATRIAASGKAAKLAIDRAEAQVLTEIIAGGLTSDAARAFLESIPTPEQLMPALTVAELEAGR